MKQHLTTIVLFILAIIIHNRVIVPFMNRNYISTPSQEIISDNENVVAGPVDYSDSNSEIII